MFASYSTTCRRLHGLAEVVLAGPRYVAGGSMRLRADHDGITTWDDPPIRLSRGRLERDDARVEVAGRTFAEAAAAVVEHALDLGNSALRLFAPDLEPVLWPEHFDIAITRADVNYGVSPGDGHPYAYVGPHGARRGSFWNAPFGAARPVTEFADAEALAGFFREGARQADR
jgi:hypothetical protein